MLPVLEMNSHYRWLARYDDHLLINVLIKGNRRYCVLNSDFEVFNEQRRFAEYRISYAVVY